MIKHTVALWLCSVSFWANANAQSPDEVEIEALNPKKDTLPSGKEVSFHEDLYPSLRWQVESAWQPPKSQLSIGIWKAAYAPTDWLSVSTWTFPWLLRIPSIETRVSIWSDRKWAVGASVGVIHINPANLPGAAEQAAEESSDAENAPQGSVNTIPISLFVSYRLSERWLLSAAIRQYSVAVSGDTDSSESEVTVEGAIATDSTHLRLQVGFALSSKWSLWFISNQLLYQGLRGYTYTRTDLPGNGTLEFYFEASSDVLNFADANARGFRLVRRGKRSIFAVGLDQGKAPIYSTGFVPPAAIPLPYTSWELYF